MLRALALGAIAAIAVPFVLLGRAGMLGDLMHIWTVRPIPGQFGLIFSVPVFLIVFLMGWVLFKASDNR